MKVSMKDGSVQDLTFADELGQEAFHHTTSHILAQAVKRLYPDTKCAIGPAIKDGYYYDFEFSFPFTTEHLEAVEKEMRKIVKEALPLERFTMNRQEAIDLMKEKNEPYKVELIEDLPEDAELSFYKQGEYLDLCAGPHVSNTSVIKAFKLQSVAGAYWRGDEHRQMLTRIYGTSFPKAAELEAYLKRMEEARLRDHRKLGKELGLFAIMDEGPGFPFFLPKGMVLKNLYTTVIDDEDYAVKPMNCPGGMLVYKVEPRSYKDLPMRVGELGLVHRHEKSGQLHGLMRVRCFTQDDAHIFMTEDQIRDEIKGVARLIDEVYSKFGFKYHVELSTRPEDSMGSDEDWEMATEGLRGALDELGLAYVVNEGDGAFYGPKIDFHLEDSIGRTWQCGTIQLDFQMPQRFDLEYTGADGEKHRPIMIHRVAFGSIERFIGILIEHYAGKFPTWLAPVQVKVMAVSEKFADYAQKIQDELIEAGVRSEIDLRNEKLGYKIREAQMEKVPYMVIVGEKEVEEGTISVRKRDEGDIGGMKAEELIARIKAEV